MGTDKNIKLHIVTDIKVKSSRPIGMSYNTAGGFGLMKVKKLSSNQ